jgi:hypothetical protein
MGSWSVSCGISNIVITAGKECVILPLKKSLRNEYSQYLPATLPIFGKYNDYGGMDCIIEDDNTKLIESKFGVTIQEFVDFLVDGKFTYDRNEAKAIKEKLTTDEPHEYRFMWIDKNVYDVVKNFYSNYSYDSKHLKWRNSKSEGDKMRLLGYIVDYNFNGISIPENILSLYSGEQLDKIKDLLKSNDPDNISNYYVENVNEFGDRLCDLINIRHNMYAMSSGFMPHKLYMTPQCGERKQHQILLEEFARINKSYITEED